MRACRRMSSPPEARALTGTGRWHPELKSRPAISQRREHPKGCAPAERVTDRGRAPHAVKTCGGEAQPDEERRVRFARAERSPRPRSRRCRGRSCESPRTLALMSQPYPARAASSDQRRRCARCRSVRFRGWDEWRDNDRFADGHADRIPTDEQTGLRDARAETGGDVQQQADDALGRPDGESR